MLNHTKIDSKLKTLAAAAALTLVAGCGSSGQPSSGSAASADSTGTTVIAGGGGKVCLTADAVVYVVPAHRAAASGIPADTLCAAEEAANTSKPLGVVSVEGSPRVLVPVQTRELTGNNDKTRKASAVQIVVSAYQAAQQASPTSDGNDLMSALAIASDAARSAVGPSGTIQIIVLDPGLSDSGAINFAQHGAMSADPVEVANHVKKTGQCPDSLRGAKVTLVGTGYGLAPQKELTIADRARVTTTWTKTLSSCGSTTTVVPGRVSGSAPKTQHTVALVTPSSYESFKLNGTVNLVGDSPLAFQPDQTTYLHPDQATPYLDDLAKKMRQNPRTHLEITGRTAYGTNPDYLKKLSLARANAVRTDLVNRGISPDRITTNGLGYTANPPQTSPATAALNRVATFTFTTP